MELSSLTMGNVLLVVLLLAMAAFLGMVVVCGIGGLADIRSLFRTLREDDEAPEEETRDEAP